MGFRTESPLARIRKVIVGANEISREAEEVMVRDAEKMLSCYFEVTKGSTSVDVEVGADGACNVIIKCHAEKVKNVRLI